jgi:hypothetical protein
MKEVWKFSLGKKFVKSKFGNEILVIEKRFLCSQVYFDSKAILIPQELVSLCYVYIHSRE